MKYENGAEESADEGAVRRRHERAMELAAMFKELGKGNMAAANRILAKFSLQEGVSVIKTKGYFTLLKQSGLVKISKGEKRWTYHQEFEWENFKVEL
jgi:hypothetical protein